MGVMVYSLLWVMQDLYHQPYLGSGTFRDHVQGLRLGVQHADVSTVTAWMQGLRV